MMTMTTCPQEMTMFQHYDTIGCTVGLKRKNTTITRMLIDPDPNTGGGYDFAKKAMPAETLGMGL